MTQEDSNPSASDANSSKTMRSAGTTRIIAELGHGGMANVYLAVSYRQAGVKKLVVLKALRQELETEPDAVAMFVDEARLAAQLNHPNVVQTYEVTTHDDRHVIVMEYLDGQSLSRIWHKAHAAGRPVPLAIQLRILSSVLEGLHYAHELTSYDGKALHLVHRDVSPQNVFVTYDGGVKILDFGIAKLSSSTKQTETGIVKGKLAYMPPEQMCGSGIDRRADIFAVGCMLWAAATGQKLWHGVPDAQIMNSVLNGEIPSPRSVNPNCDDELVRIVEKCLHRDPEARYATALELQADLDKYAEQLSSPVSQRAVGKLVSELFADSRARIRSLIEAQLSQLSSDDAPLTSIRLVDDMSASSGGITTRQGRGGSLVLLMAGAAVVALVTWLGVREFTRPAPQPVAVAAPSPPRAEEPPKAPESPRSATLSFDITPTDARLFLDGEQLGPGVRSRVMPVDHSRHTLRAEADGYQPSAVEFVVAGDHSLNLRLAPALPEPKATAAPRRHVRSAPQKKPNAEAAPQPPKPDCTNPFFLDENAIKRVRPECR